MSVMKLSILICLLFFQALVWSEEKKSTVVTGGVVVNDSIQKLLDVDGVKPLYESCVNRYIVPGVAKSNATATQDVYGCLWRDISDPKNAALKKKVLQAYNEETKTDTKKDSVIQAGTASIGRSPSSLGDAKPKESSNLLTKQDNLSVDYTNDPAVAALSNFYANKLDEILDPEKALSKDDAKKGTIVSVDHQKFVQLYKSELAKTIVNAFSSYCLDADPVSHKMSADKDTTKKNREKNLELLKKADLTDGSPDSQKWTMCIATVPDLCNPKMVNSVNENGQSNDDERETGKRACLIVDYVKAARKNIIVADAQLEDYKKMNSEQSINIVQNTKDVIDQKKLKSDSILEITSADVEKSLKNPMTKEESALKECYKTSANGANGQIVNEEACKKYLSTDAEASSKAMVEMGIRQELKQAKLEEDLQSTDKVREYLKAEGYSDDVIKEMTKDQTKIGTTRDEIIDRYKAQKQAIIAEMAAKIQSKTSTNNGKIDKQADLSKIQKIAEEMNERKGDLKNLVQFNNIVSAYLSFSDKNDKNSKAQRNTASLFAEVESMEATEAQDLNKNIGTAKLNDARKSTGNTEIQIDVKDVNKLMKYSTEQK